MEDGDLDLLKYNMVDSVSCSCCQSTVCKEDEAITSETGGFASRVRNPYLPAAQWGQIDPTGLGLWSMSSIFISKNGTGSLYNKKSFVWHQRVIDTRGQSMFEEG